MKLLRLKEIPRYYGIYAIATVLAIGFGILINESLEYRLQRQAGREQIENAQSIQAYSKARAERYKNHPREPEQNPAGIEQILHPIVRPPKPRGPV